MTSAPVVDERVHATAVEALLSGPLNGKVYDYSTLPSTVPNIFAVYSIERRYVPPRTASGVSGRSGWRVSVRFVGRTVDDARWAANKVTQALDEKRLSIGGETSTPVVHESTRAIEEDGDRFSGWSIYTYSL